MKQYKATYLVQSISGQLKFSTRYYPTTEQAQDTLGKRIGGFPHLGAANGDTFERGVCEVAARNGGTVSVDEREV